MITMEDLKTDPKFVSRLPTELDILGFVEKLMADGITKNDAVHKLSEELINTWKKADCPPVALRVVKQKMMDLLQVIKRGKKTTQRDSRGKEAQDRGSHQKISQTCWA